MSFSMFDDCLHQYISPEKIVIYNNIIQGVSDNV